MRSCARWPRCFQANRVLGSLTSSLEMLQASPPAGADPLGRSAPPQSPPLAFTGQFPGGAGKARAFYPPAPERVLAAGDDRDERGCTSVSSGPLCEGGGVLQEKGRARRYTSQEEIPKVPRRPSLSPRGRPQTSRAPSADRSRRAHEHAVEIARVIRVGDEIELLVKISAGEALPHIAQRREILDREAHAVEDGVLLVVAAARLRADNDLP